jgi:hypothetical protein
MPLFGNKYDLGGRPICQKCAQPILPSDSIVLLDDAMIHARYVAWPSFRGSLRRTLSPRGVIEAPRIVPAT